MNKYYVSMFDDDYLITARNRKTGKDETVFFNSYAEAESYILKEGFKQGEFDIYESEVLK